MALVITADEVENYAEALAVSPIVRAAELFQAAYKQEALYLHIHTIHKDPWTFRIDVVARLLDPLTGEPKEVTLGTLNVPTPVKPNDVTNSDVTQPFSVQPSAALN